MWSNAPNLSYSNRLDQCAQVLDQLLTRMSRDRDNKSYVSQLEKIQKECGPIFKPQVNSDNAYVRKRTLQGLLNKFPNDHRELYKQFQTTAMAENLKG